MTFEEGDRVEVDPVFSCGCAWCKSLIKHGGIIVDFDFRNNNPIIRPDKPRSMHMEAVNTQYLTPKVSKTQKQILENYDI